VIAPAAEQLSLALAATVGTAAWQLASALALESAGQFTVGAVVSVTVKLVAQVALLPVASVAVTVMVCAPRPTSVPAAGDWLKVIPLVPLQPPLKVTPPRTSGTAAWQFASALAFGVSEQTTVGVALPLTAKRVMQVTLLPAASVAVMVIVFVPRPTSVPAAGLWLKMIASLAVQLSLAMTPPRTSGTAA